MRTIVAALLAVVVAAAGVLADAAASNNAARRTIAFVPLPELGHFNPFAAVIDGYVRSEPTARCRVLVPEFFRLLDVNRLNHAQRSVLLIDGGTLL